MLPAGRLEAEFLRFQATGRQYVELFGIINKPLLLHLVGCLYYSYLILSDTSRRITAVHRREDERVLIYNEEEF
jgi:hypothetical protein